MIVDCRLEKRLIRQRMEHPETKFIFFKAIDGRDWIHGVISLPDELIKGKRIDVFIRVCKL